jgi:hypothetical protein
MIKNFEEVKKQLAELSGVVNKFKSEQVQLKIVELVFRGAGVDVEQPQTWSDPPPARKRGARRNKGSGTGTAPEAGSAKKRVVAGTGPMPTLERFIQDGFFNQKRTIGVVVEHCKTKARNFKSNEVSGPLGRLVRNNKLSRTKNSDGQWEYVKK